MFSFVFEATVALADWQKWFFMEQVFGTLQSQSSTYKTVQRSIKK
jgi:hypothetical protein